MFIISDICRRVVPPNKRKMEAEVDALGKEILEKDNKLVSLQKYQK
jgi:dephospho-CoA kinase